MNKPKDANNFLDSLQIVKKEKMKAANLLFEEIENDVMQKEKFVSEQMDKMRRMKDSHSMLVDFQEVLIQVLDIYKAIGGGVNIRSSEGGTLNDEERKDNAAFSLNSE